ncbi:hypothetical protein [Pseudogracilibacillus sp. SO30301A]|uniref:hypothetical protein n=1 Tax=Pseudogracilibacillus sp. SO30301A TaxID=3098291 RepID=UPI00300E01F9
MIQKDKVDEDKKWDKTWNIIWWFFGSTIIIGGFTLAYFGERDQLGIIMENVLIKSLIMTFGAIGVFCIVYSEVRKRSDASTFKKVMGTFLVIIVVFTIFAITRL